MISQVHQPIWKNEVYESKAMYNEPLMFNQFTTNNSHYNHGRICVKALNSEGCFSFLFAMFEITMSSTASFPTKIPC